MTFPGAFNEEKTHIMAMQLAQAADRWNVPLIVESLPYGYPVTSDDSNNPAIIAASARAAVELGADVIKTRFTGSPEDRLIIEAAGVPVLALGGPKPASTVTSNLFSTVCRWVRKAWLWDETLPRIRSRRKW